MRNNSYLVPNRTSKVIDCTTLLKSKKRQNNDSKVGSYKRYKI